MSTTVVSPRPAFASPTSSLPRAAVAGDGAHRPRESSASISSQWTALPMLPKLQTPSSPLAKSPARFTQRAKNAGGNPTERRKTLGAKDARDLLTIPTFPQPPSFGSQAVAVRSDNIGLAFSSPRSRTHDGLPLSTRDEGRPSSGVRANSAGAAGTLLSRLPCNPALPSVGVETAESRSSRGESVAKKGTIEMSRRRESTRSRSSKCKDGKGNVVVSVRVKPENGRGPSDKEQWIVDGQRSLISYQGKEGDYFYDNVFTANDQNAKVYDAAAKRLVRRVMEGYHGTVFAYGMTGTGKTFSMQGTATSPGIIPLAITDIFSFIRETPHREFLLRVSYLEIYNEKITDLLAASGGSSGPTGHEEIKLREDSKRGVYATGLKEEIVQSPTQLLRVIAKGDQARRTASTQYNQRSSRSHAVVQIVVESRERTPVLSTVRETNRSATVQPGGAGGVRVSTLSLIDLAGSERASENKERRTEGSHINKSLLTLGTVVSKLSGDRDKEGNPTDKDGKHIPYRDSKLTRLLQGALSGDSLISILCTIQVGTSGSASTANQLGETVNTLKFAARAKNNIVSRAKRSADEFPGDPNSRALLDRYRTEIAQLRRQLEMQGKSSAKLALEEQERAREREEEERRETQLVEIQMARTALAERIKHLNRLIIDSKSSGVNSSRSISAPLSMVPRTSPASNTNSCRGSALSTTSEITSPSGRSSVTSTSKPGLFSTANSPIPGLEGSKEDEEEDSFGESNDGRATWSAQIRALQATVSEKNRYIATLERRLLEAQAPSPARDTNGLEPQAELGQTPEGGMQTLLREKDGEISELRRRLDDKDRMMSALQSAVRSGGRRGDVRLGGGGSSSSTQAYHAVYAPTRSPVSPVQQLLDPPETERKEAKGMDSMSRMLDELIQERVRKRESSVSAAAPLDARTVGQAPLVV